MNDALFHWLDSRSSGVLLHPTSLPNSWAVGNLGASARAFVDLARSCGFRHWQMLPLGPTGFGNSPYQSFSSHAINPLLLDWEPLLERGWIHPNSLLDLKNREPGSPVDFVNIQPLHESARRMAVEKGLQDPSVTDAYQQFLKDQKSWISDYAVFMALRKANQGKPWQEWKPASRDYAALMANPLPRELDKEMELIQFEQFLLFTQWMELKQYANERNLSIIGDIPIYVSPDSVDVWANRDVFQVTKSGKFTKLAGVPPDYFNENGQFWGNPLYNWKQLKADAYRWWIDRLKHTLSLFDVVRFDHFRALAGYWSIPSGASSAKEGKWVKGPGIDFFRAIHSKLPSAKLILEDLGEITPDVIELRDATGCPGLAVLQFAFGGGNDNFYLPHNLSRNTVVYTGTHDNDTSLGWYENEQEKTQDHFRRYLRVSGTDAGWDLIRAAYASIAELCVVPVQDLLSLGSDSRMNTPGEALGNWAWRMSDSQMFDIGSLHSEYLREIAELYRRNP